MSSIALLVAGAAAVGAVHSLLPDHWVPLAVVARTQHWSLLRLARVSALAAGGHVLVSIVLGGVIAVIGLQFQRQVEAQQGHIVGGLLVLTGIGFLAWALTGHGHHAHPHGSEQPGDAHQHGHVADDQLSGEGSHAHEHSHGDVHHSHRHHHEAYVKAQAMRISERSNQTTWIGRLTVIAVPFGAAASPDLTFLPFALAASVFGAPAVAGVLGVFALVTMVTFVGLTLAATAAGYQMQGEWLEKNADMITAVVLIGIGLVVLVGL